MSREETFKLEEDERKHHARLLGERRALESAVEGGLCKVWPEKWRALAELNIAIDEDEYRLIEKYGFDLDDVDYVTVAPSMGIIYSESF